MPDLVVSNEGERELLRIDLKAALVDFRIWHLRLYSNDYTPNRDTEVDDFVEVAWSGYAAELLDPEVWQDPVTQLGQAVSYYGLSYLQFTPTLTGGTVYGYYITFDDGDKLLWSQRFDVPQVASTSAPVIVWPVFAGRSASEPAPPPP